MRTVNCEEIYRFDTSRLAGVLVSRIISEARSGMGATKSTGPSYLIALRGMSGYAASSGFWTMAMPPAFLMAASPRAPSSSYPESTTPMVLAPQCCANEINS